MEKKMETIGIIGRDQKGLYRDYRGYIVVILG